MACRPLVFNLFCVGNSADINTWSNLPYFFSRSLMKNGIELNRINLIPEDTKVYKCYKLIYEKWRHLKSRMGYQSQYDIYRDIFLKFIIENQIKKQTLKYSQSSLNIFLTYSFSSYKFSRTPVVHYSDQTYDLYLKDTDKKIAKWDTFFIDIEKKNLRNSAHIFATNRKCSEFISQKYELDNVTPLRGGINLDDSVIENQNEILNLKKENKEILFIGRGAHKRGVDVLIDAFIRFNRLHENSYTLRIVGIPNHSLTTIDDRIVVYGYLNKKDPSDYETYYNLLKKARLFVMPMRHGPRPGVVKEAGLLYTPVIITDIWNMGEVVKDNVNGILVGSPDARIFAEKMDYLVKNQMLWERLAVNAHEIAKRKYSWDKVVGVFLGICSNYIDHPVHYDVTHSMVD